MPYKWPEKRQLVGKSYTRHDGALKVSGKAKYSYDKNLPGMLQGKILRSPHAHAKIKSLDLKPAEEMPGVKAAVAIKKVGDTLRYVGDEIAAVAAETEEQAREAARAIKVEYDVLPHVVDEEDAKKDPAAKVDNFEQGKVADGFAQAAVTVEGFYGVPVITHLCLESHGLVAYPKGDDEFVVYCSTQNVHGVARDVKGRVGGNVKVLSETPFMGGGFGSKFAAGVEGLAAVDLARKAKRPVKLLLERDEEQLMGGNRPSLFAKVKAGASQEGKLVALEIDSWGTTGIARRMPYIYLAPNAKIRTAALPVNTGGSRAWRAPSHPQASAVMEQIMDDLADKLGMDPVEFRLKNLPQNDLGKIWERELKMGAERIGWKGKYHSRGDKTPGPIKKGLGIGCSTWGGGPGNSQSNCTIFPDGRVEVRCGTQDLGTGTTTLVPIVAAEILGLEVKDVKGMIGSSEYPPSGGSGGSTTCGGVSLSVGVASMKALEELFKKAAPELGVKAEELEAEGGKVYVKANPAKSLTWKQACALLGQQPASANADKNEADKSMATAGVAGAQFAEVSVDVETGEVRLLKFVAIADCGMVMNRILCESQVIGGVIMGINPGLCEERRMDKKTGRVLNADMEWYKVVRHSDIGEIDVVLLDMPERGVIGIGEPPCIPGAAAVANAVCNAIGVRVGVLPVTPKRVLDALAKK